MMSSPVIKYSISLIIIMSIMMFGILATVYWNSQRDKQYYELSTGYHLASLKHIAVLKEEVHLLRLRRTIEVGHDNLSPQQAVQSQYGRNLVNALALMASATNALQDLQLRYANLQFSAGLTRLQDSVRVVRHRLINNSLTPTEHEAVVEPLLIVLQQLERLHIITYEDRLSAEAFHKQRGRINTLVILIFVVLSSAALVGLFITKMRAAVTGQLQAEDELRALNSELDQRIEQRTAELESARNEAEQANHAKSDFLSRMSHELRTPLNAILGFGQLLQAHKLELGERETKFIEGISAAGNHLLNLINEVLELSRIESNIQDVSLEDVELNDVVAECLSLAEPLAKQKRITLVNSIPFGKCYVVRGNFLHIKQALINLISNAIKYGPEHSDILLACREISRHELRLDVTDNGPGIPLDKQPLLFRPFERLDEVSSVEGTGIGLAITKKLVELMHGELGLDSEPGKGSTFWIRLQLSDSTQNNKQSTMVLGLDNIPLTRVRQNKYTMLYVEDNRFNVQLMESLLEYRPDIRLLVASDGRSGLDMAVAHDIDLILLDIQLPDMSGFQVFEALQKHAPSLGIPVIAVSANAMTHDIKAGKDAGFFDYIVKPIDVSLFLQRLQQLLPPDQPARSLHADDAVKI